jgi:DNA-binding IclR family transcriptional regulator
VVKVSLAASRAIQVVDFMSVHPGQPYSLTEISRALKINAASTLSVLAALAEAGYVVRHPAHKTYTLGAALVAVGHAALVQNPALSAASEELILVSEEIGAQCTGSVLMGDMMVALMVEGQARRSGTFSRVGERVPFSAPFGAPFAAYGDEGLRERWMQRKNGTTASAERTELLKRALGEVRDRGYSVSTDSDSRERLGRTVWALADDPHDDGLRLEVDRLLDELSDQFVAVNLGPGDVTEIANVTVPVFSSTGVVAMIITGVGFASPLAGTAVAEVGNRLRRSADAISTRAFGSPAAAASRRS